MGNILLIRVSATTFDEKELKKHYPNLCKLAWNKEDKYIPAAQVYGIFELIQTLNDAYKYACWPQELLDLPFLAEDLKFLLDTYKSLQEYLLAWEPKKANELSFVIEEALDSLEKKVKALKLKNFDAL